MKFYKLLEKYVSKVSKNFELNRTCKSTTDQKTYIRLGFSWSFQNEFRSDHNQNLLEPNVRRGLKSDLHPRGNPQEYSKHKNSKVPHKSTREEREEHKRKETQNFSKNEN
jgi:hypothetical protein